MEDIERSIEERKAAKRRRDFSAADRIRDDLAATWLGVGGFAYWKNLLGTGEYLIEAALCVGCILAVTVWKRRLSPKTTWALAGAASICMPDRVRSATCRSLRRGRACERGWVRGSGRARLATPLRANRWKRPASSSTPPAWCETVTEGPTCEQGPRFIAARWTAIGWRVVTDDARCATSREPQHTTVPRVDERRGPVVRGSARS